MTPLPSNHRVEDSPENTLHHYLEEDGRTLFYGLDGGWLTTREYDFLCGKHTDVFVFDGTVGDYIGDQRMGSHNSVPMIRMMLASLRNEGAFAEDGLILLSHIAPVLYGGMDHEQTDRLLAKIEPHDLMKFGLIPEFVGRVPICVSLRGLDREALIRILQEPKNALVKQYQKLFQMDNVELSFEQDAIEAIADKALERKTGARGLRSIMESVMMDTMYEIPSDDTIEECVVTKAAVDGESEPLTIHEDSLKKAK